MDRRSTAQTVHCAELDGIPSYKFFPNKINGYLSVWLIVEQSRTIMCKIKHIMPTLMRMLHIVEQHAVI